jgi:tRNA(Ile)-lysidine synthase
MAADHSPDPTATIDRALSAALETTQTAGRLLVGFSGGLDSTVLLHALARAAREGLVAERDRIIAVHINHHLQPAADDWQRHCETVCAGLAVPFMSRSVTIRATAGIEAAARAARETVWVNLLETGDRLLLGHHRDDQIETLLLRLLRRGGGAALLAGMAPQRTLGAGVMLRPLLSLPRSVLHDYAQQHRLTWIEDPSNTGQEFDRNFLRHDILPRIVARIPGAFDSLAHAALRLGEDARLVTQALEAGVAACRRQVIMPGCAGPPLTVLCVPSVLAQPAPARLLRQWLAGAGYHALAARALDEFVVQLARAPADRDPTFRPGPGSTVRRHRALLYLVPDAALNAEPVARRWAPAVPLVVAAGTLAARRVDGPGLDGNLTELTVGPPVAPDTLRPHGQQQRRTVARLLHDAGVPPWLRPVWPRVYVDGELAAVPGIATSAKHARARGSNWQLEWCPTLMQRGR